VGGWVGGWAQRDLSGCDIKMRCGARDEWCDINVATKARCRIRSKPESGVSQHNRQHDNGAPSRSLPSYPTPSAPGGQQGTSSCRGRRRGRPVCLCVSMCVCVCARARARLVTDQQLPRKKAASRLASHGCSRSVRAPSSSHSASISSKS
jgi:hypothetical protein